MKDLTINGTVYAKYKMEGNTLFLKMIVQVIPGKGNEKSSEDILILLIQRGEDRLFQTVSYLNV